MSVFLFHTIYQCAFILVLAQPLTHISFNWQSPRSGSPGYTGAQYSEPGPSADNKMPLTDFGSFRPVVQYQ